MMLKVHNMCLFTASLLCNAEPVDLHNASLILGHAVAEQHCCLQKL
jgi:hypothetical protein